MGPEPSPWAIAETQPKRYANSIGPPTVSLPIARLSGVELLIPVPLSLVLLLRCRSLSPVTSGVPAVMSPRVRQIRVLLSSRVSTTVAKESSADVLKLLLRRSVPLPSERCAVTVTRAVERTSKRQQRVHRRTFFDLLLVTGNTSSARQMRAALPNNDDVPNPGTRRSARWVPVTTGICAALMVVAVLAMA